MVFLALLGYYGDSGKTENITPHLLSKAQKLIPEMLEKGNRTYCEIQKYVSYANVGMRMQWNANFILEMLCETNSLKDFLAKKHSAHKKIEALKKELRELKNFPVNIMHGRLVDYAVINCQVNIQGMLAAQNTKDRPLLVLNRHNGMAVGSLRVPQNINFDAGKYLQNLTPKIDGITAGGHKKAAGITMPEIRMKELIIELEKSEKVIALP